MFGPHMSSVYTLYLIQIAEVVIYIIMHYNFVKIVNGRYKINLKGDHGICARIVRWVVNKLDTWKRLFDEFSVYLYSHNLQLTKDPATSKVKHIKIDSVIISTITVMCIFDTKYSKYSFNIIIFNSVLLS